MRRPRARCALYLQAHYSAADNYNAYSLPTGDMIFYEPLVKALSDEELAFVVGHEIAHAVLFHHSERNFHKMFVSDTLDDILCTVTGQMCSGKGRDVGPGFFRDASMSAAGMALQARGYPHTSVVAPQLHGRARMHAPLRSLMSPAAAARTGLFTGR